MSCGEWTECQQVPCKFTQSLAFEVVKHRPFRSNMFGNSVFRTAFQLRNGIDLLRARVSVSTTSTINITDCTWILVILPCTAFELPSCCLCSASVARAGETDKNKYSHTDPHAEAIGMKPRLI
jgi:hypothetical protein